MGPIGIWELLIILFIIILIFGATRLPQIGGGIGKGEHRERGGHGEQAKGQVLHGLNPP